MNVESLQSQFYHMVLKLKKSGKRASSHSQKTKIFTVNLIYI